MKRFYFWTAIVLFFGVASVPAQADDDIRLASGGCVASPVYEKVMVQCTDGTVSIVSGSILTICRATGDGETKCTEKDISRGADEERAKYSGKK